MTKGHSSRRRPSGSAARDPAAGGRDRARRRRGARGRADARPRPAGDAQQRVRSPARRLLPRAASARRRALGARRRRDRAAVRDRRGDSARPRMSRSFRLGLFAISAAGLAALLRWGVAGLPDFGHYRGPYGYVLNAVAPNERHVTNVVAATVFDYRGFDTLGEEFILFSAAMGVALLLREVREEGDRVTDGLHSDAVRLVGLAFVPLLLVLALVVVAHGTITPGGGFQGGVAIAGAFV